MSQICSVSTHHFYGAQRGAWLLVGSDIVGTVTVSRET